MSKTQDQDISTQLAQLLTRVEIIQDITDAMSDKINTIEQQGIRLEQCSKTAHRRLDGISPQVQELRDLKNRSQGVFIAISVIFGALSGFILHFFPKAQ